MRGMSVMRIGVSQKLKKVNGIFKHAIALCLAFILLCSTSLTPVYAKYTGDHEGACEENQAYEEKESLLDDEGSIVENNTEKVMGLEPLTITAYGDEPRIIRILFSESDFHMIPAGATDLSTRLHTGVNVDEYIDGTWHDVTHKATITYNLEAFSANTPGTYTVIYTAELIEEGEVVAESPQATRSIRVYDDTRESGVEVIVRELSNGYLDFGESGTLIIQYTQRADENVNNRWIKVEVPNQFDGNGFGYSISNMTIPPGLSSVIRSIEYTTTGSGLAQRNQIMWIRLHDISLGTNVIEIHVPFTAMINAAGADAYRANMRVSFTATTFLSRASRPSVTDTDYASYGEVSWRFPEYYGNTLEANSMTNTDVTINNIGISLGNNGTTLNLPRVSLGEISKSAGMTPTGPVRIYAPVPEGMIASSSVMINGTQYFQVPWTHQAITSNPMWTPKHSANIGSFTVGNGTAAAADSQLSIRYDSIDWAETKKYTSTAPFLFELMQEGESRYYPVLANGEPVYYSVTVEGYEGLKNLSVRPVSTSARQFSQGRLDIRMENITFREAEYDDLIIRFGPFVPEIQPQSININTGNVGSATGAFPAKIRYQLSDGSFRETNDNISGAYVFDTNNGELYVTMVEVMPERRPFSINSINTSHLYIIIDALFLSRYADGPLKGELLPDSHDASYPVSISSIDKPLVNKEFTQSFSLTRPSSSVNLWPTPISERVAYQGYPGRISIENGLWTLPEKADIDEFGFVIPDEYMISLTTNQNALVHPKSMTMNMVDGRVSYSLANGTVIGPVYVAAGETLEFDGVISGDATARVTNITIVMSLIDFYDPVPYQTSVFSVDNDYMTHFITGAFAHQELPDSIDSDFDLIHSIPSTGQSAPVISDESTFTLLKIVREVRIISASDLSSSPAYQLEPKDARQTGHSPVAIVQVRNTADAGLSRFVLTIDTSNTSEEFMKSLSAVGRGHVNFNGGTVFYKLSDETHERSFNLSGNNVTPVQIPGLTATNHVTELRIDQPAVVTTATGFANILMFYMDLHRYELVSGVDYSVIGYQSPTAIISATADFTGSIALSNLLVNGTAGEFDTDTQNSGAWLANVSLNSAPASTASTYFPGQEIEFRLQNFLMGAATSKRFHSAGTSSANIVSGMQIRQGFIARNCINLGNQSWGATTALTLGDQTLRNVTVYIPIMKGFSYVDGSAHIASGGGVIGDVSFIPDAPELDGGGWLRIHLDEYTAPVGSHSAWLSVSVPGSDIRYSVVSSTMQQAGTHSVIGNTFYFDITDTTHATLSLRLHDEESAGMARAEYADPSVFSPYTPGRTIIAGRHGNNAAGSTLSAFGQLQGTTSINGHGFTSTGLLSPLSIQISLATQSGIALLGAHRGQLPTGDGMQILYHDGDKLDGILRMVHVEGTPEDDIRTNIVSYIDIAYSRQGGHNGLMLEGPVMARSTDGSLSDVNTAFGGQVEVLYGIGNPTREMLFTTGWDETVDSGYVTAGEVSNWSDVTRIRVITHDQGRTERQLVLPLVCRETKSFPGEQIARPTITYRTTTSTPIDIIDYMPAFRLQDYIISGSFWNDENETGIMLDNSPRLGGSIMARQAGTDRFFRIVAVSTSAGYSLEIPMLGDYVLYASSNGHVPVQGPPATSDSSFAENGTHQITVVGDTIVNVGFKAASPENPIINNPNATNPENITVPPSGLPPSGLPPSGLPPSGLPLPPSEPSSHPEPLSPLQPSSPSESPQPYLPSPQLPRLSAEHTTAVVDEPPTSSPGGGITRQRVYTPPKQITAEAMQFPGRKEIWVNGGEDQKGRNEIFINNASVPLAGGAILFTGNVRSVDFWALLNLILAVFGAAIAIITGMRILISKKRKDDNEELDEDEMFVDDEGKNSARCRLICMIAMIVTSVAGILLFILTQDMTKIMRLIDWWTLIHLIILAVEIKAIIFIKKRIRNKDRDTSERNSHELTRTV